MRPTRKAELIEHAEQLARQCREINKANEKLSLETSVAYARVLGEFFGFCRAMYAAHIFSAGDLLNLKNLAFDEVPPSIASFINSLETIDALDATNNKGDS